MLTLETLAEQAKISAGQLGITKFDIFGATINETSVQVDQGKPKQVKASNRSSVIVRVWNSAQQVGVTTTTDTDADGITLALKTALEASVFGVREHCPDFSPEATTPLDPLPDPVVEPTPASDLVDRLIDAERSLLEAHPAIKGVPYNGLGQRDVERFYLNSDGSLRQGHNATTSIYLVSRTEEEGRKPRSAGAIRLSHGLSDLDIAGCLQEASEKTISHLNYEKVASGKYMVVFSPEAFLSLLSAFSNIFNAQSILDKQSLSTPDSLGATLASPLLSVYDDARHPDNIGAVAFDGEGTPTRRLSLISKGVLTHFLHSSVTAQRLGANLTGHGSIGAKVSVGSHFYHVLSEVEPEASYRIEEADQVIYIDELQALHAGVKSTQGSFSLPFDGWLLKQGTKTSIESATVAGDFRELLQSIVHVDDQAQVTPGGVCPHIWIRDLSITGE